MDYNENISPETKHNKKMNKNPPNGNKRPE